MERGPNNSAAAGNVAEKEVDTMTTAKLKKSFAIVGNADQHRISADQMARVFVAMGIRVMKDIDAGEWDKAKEAYLMALEEYTLAVTYAMTAEYIDVNTIDPKFLNGIEMKYKLRALAYKYYKLW